MKHTNSADITFTFRIDPALKAEFTAAAEKEQKAAAKILRELMIAYVERKKRKEFESEARRQSRLIADSPEEEQVMDWIRNVTDRGTWK